MDTVQWTVLDRFTTRIAVHIAVRIAVRIAFYIVVRTAYQQPWGNLGMYTALTTSSSNLLTRYYLLVATKSLVLTRSRQLTVASSLASSGVTSQRSAREFSQ